MKDRLSVDLPFVVGRAGPMQSCARDDAVKIVAAQVLGDIYTLTGKGGNTGLFNGGDGGFMIDGQFAPLTDRIIAAVKSTGGIFTADKWIGVVYPAVF